MRRLFTPVLLPRRHPQPRRARDARLDPRGRRARLRARRTPTAPLRQPRPRRRRASSATARPRPGRWPPAGTATSSSTPPATAPCCRSCTSTATRSPTRPCSPGSRDEELRTLLPRLRVHAVRGRGRRPGGDAPGVRRHARPLPRRDRASIQARPASEGRTERPRWPMIVLRTPKGWTGPKEVDGAQVEGYVALPPGAVRRRPGERRPPRRPGGVDAQLPARGALRRRRGAGRRRRATCTPPGSGG